MTGNNPAGMTKIFETCDGEEFLTGTANRIFLSIEKPKRDGGYGSLLLCGRENQTFAENRQPRPITCKNCLAFEVRVVLWIK